MSGNRPPKTSPHVRTHFERRLKERYGIEITRKECKQLESDLPAYLPLLKASLSRSWFLIPIKDQLVYACYQNHLGLTTVLTPDQFWDSNQSLQIISPAPELDAIKLKADEDKKKLVPHWNEQLVKQRNPPAPFAAEPTPDTQDMVIRINQSYAEQILCRLEKIELAAKTEIRGRGYLYAIGKPIKSLSKSQREKMKMEPRRFDTGSIVGTVEIKDCVPSANGYEWHFSNPERLAVQIPIPKGCRVVSLPPAKAV